MEVQRKTINVNGLNISYMEKGEGSPLVCLHGNPGSASDFENQVITNHRLIAFDRPGHGFSQRYDAKTGHLDLQVDVLHGFLTALNLKEVILTAHSWGCFIALAYALKHPENLKGLLLIAPVVYLRKDSQSYARLVNIVQTPVIGGGMAWIFAKLAGGSLAKKLEEAYLPDAMPDDYRKSVLPMLLTTRSLQSMLEDKEDFESRVAEISQQYGSLNIRTLIINGENDTTSVPDAQGERLREAIKDARSVILPNVGHYIPQLRQEIIGEYSMWF